MKISPEIKMPMRIFLLSSMIFVAVGCWPPSEELEPEEEPAIASTSTAVTTDAEPVPGAPKELRPRRVEAGVRPVEAIERVLIISIDGLRPDLLLRAFMPRVRGLCNGGSYTFWAKTTLEAYTLPCHVTMLTGALSEKHGVTWNTYIEDSYPNVPTLFEVAKQAGYSTAMVSGKMKFIALARPGTIDHSFLPPDEPVSDHDVAVEAERMLREHRPQVLFIHLPGVDSAGHEFGWGSTGQVAAIERADDAVGLILDVVADLKLTDSTLMIVTSDHGGSGKTHTRDDPCSRFIPWIAFGPGVRKDYDMTLSSRRRIGIEDTFATACAFLGIDPGDECAGKPVLEVLEADGPKPQDEVH